MGMVGMLLAQTLENLGMCLAIVPVVGITLPFFSYGGTALAVNLGEMGIILSISRNRKYTQEDKS